MVLLVKQYYVTTVDIGYVSLIKRKYWPTADLSQFTGRFRGGMGTWLAAAGVAPML